MAANVIVSLRSLGGNGRSRTKSLLTIKMAITTNAGWIVSPMRSKKYSMSIVKARTSTNARAIRSPAVTVTGVSYAAGFEIRDSGLGIWDSLGIRNDQIPNPESLFVAQRPHRIHLRGAVGRDETCGEGDDRQRHRRGDQDHGVVAPHVEQQRLRELSDADRRRQADRAADQRHHADLAQDHAPHARRRRAERHAQADLAGPLRDGV